MLHSFTVRNFYSIREPVTLSWVLNQHAPQDDRSFTSPAGVCLSKAMAVIGPNASGKTKLINALAFVKDFMENSFQWEPKDDLPFSPHFSEQESPSEFELLFEMEGLPWRYRLLATRQRVLSESLYHKPGRVFAYVFTRTWMEEEQRYEVKQQHFGLPQKVAEKVRDKASLISMARQHDVALANRLTAALFSSNLSDLGKRHLDLEQLQDATNLYGGIDLLRQQMALLLNQWDTGLSDVVVEKLTYTTKEGQPKEVLVPFGIHRVGEREHRLFFMEESSGTQGAFVLLSRLLPILRFGGVAVIDELESDLHPHMLGPILNLFFSPKSNPNHAQLLFTTHAMEVLNHLHKGQVTLVEKNDAMESMAWRLDSIKGMRADDNLFAKYMAGAYGAVPRL